MNSNNMKLFMWYMYVHIFEALNFSFFMQVWNDVKYIFNIYYANNKK